MSNFVSITIIISFTVFLPLIIQSFTWASNGGLFLQYISELAGICILIDVYLLKNIKVIAKYICMKRK